MTALYRLLGVFTCLLYANSCPSFSLLLGIDKTFKMRNLSNHCFVRYRKSWPTPPPSFVWRTFQSKFLSVWTSWHVIPHRTKRERELLLDSFTSQRVVPLEKVNYHDTSSTTVLRYNVPRKDWNWEWAHYWWKQVIMIRLLEHLRMQHRVGALDKTKHLILLDKQIMFWYIFRWPLRPAHRPEPHSSGWGWRVEKAPCPPHQRAHSRAIWDLHL